MREMSNGMPIMLISNINIEATGWWISRVCRLGTIAISVSDGWR